MNRRAIEHHLSDARDVATGVYGVTRHIASLMDLRANGDVPGDVVNELASEFVVSSLALLAHGAASRLVDSLDTLDRLLKEENAGTKTGVENDSKNGYRVGNRHAEV
ncbi:MAG: hypothetical protein KDE45_09415 [Caldilineaceae bacterium]|nr:hypothetical protein [Caldilineaceae bacterium]